MNKRTLGSMIGLVIVVIVFALMTTPRPREEKIETVSTTIEASTVETTVEASKEEIKYYLRNDIPLTENEQTWLYEACIKNECDYSIALSVMYIETRWQNLVGDNGNSLGYFQIQPKWVQALMAEYGVTDLMDAKSNFLIGTRLLGDYIKEYGLINGLTKYNTGHTGNSIYAEKVMEARGMLYGTED